MQNRIVKYDNKMNLLAFKDLNQIEANLFFNIVSHLKEKGTDSLTLNFNDISEHIEKNLTTIELINLLRKGVGKIVQTAITWETDTKIMLFTLFQEFEIDKENKTLKAAISPKFLYILNEFKDGNFTMFELAEFSNLNSKYTQTLYRLLKQYRKTGYLVMKWTDFTEIMDIPQSYPIGMIDKRIIIPAVKELSQEPNLFEPNNPIFKKLIYKKIRGAGRGGPVEKIEFHFLPENDIKNKGREQIEREQSDFYLHTNRTIRVYDKKFNRYNLLKIEIVKKLNDEISVTLRNIDDNYRNVMKFANMKNFINFFEKYKV